MTKPTQLLREALVCVLTLNLVFLPAFAADEKKAKSPAKKVKATKKNAEKSDAQVAPITANDVQTQVTPVQNFILNDTQASSMVRTFDGLLAFYEGTGNHSKVANMSFLAFAGELNQRMHAAGVNMDGTLDLSARGPVRQWLLDHMYVSNGEYLVFHPYLAYALQVLRDSPGENFDDALSGLIAKERNAEPAKVKAELAKTSFLIQPGFSLRSNAAIGLPLNQSYSPDSKQKAFEVGPNNRPLEFDPTAITVIENLQAFRAQVSRIAFERDPSFFGRVRQHFVTLENVYNNIWQVTESLESAMYDAQGLVDTCRYKLKMPEVDTEVEKARINTLLEQAIAQRAQVARATARLISTPLNTQSLNKTAAALEPAMEQAELVATQMRRFATRAVPELDAAVGLDRRVSDSLKRDSPWEIRFQQDRKLAEAAGLSGKWESLRSHQYLYEVHHLTAHWTTQETVEDKNDKGEVIGHHTETVDHNTSSTEEIMRDFNTPSAEVQLAKIIDDLQSRIIQAKTKSDIDRLQAEIQTLIKRQAAYTVSDSNADHDYSDKFQTRNSNQLSQLETLYEQTVLMEVQAENGLPDYNRSLENPPSWKTGVADRLKKIDANHGRHLMISGGLATAAALAGGACYIWMSGALQ